MQPDADGQSDRQAGRRVSQLRRRSARHGERVLSPEPHAPDAGLRARQEARLPGAEPEADEGVGGARVPRHAGGRLRSRCRLHADRARAADGRSGPQVEPAALDDRHRADSRPGQDAVHLRRAAVGRGRRHARGGLQVLRQVRLPGVLRRQPRQHAPGLLHRQRHLRSRAAAWTTSTCPGATTSTSTTSSRITCRPRRCTRCAITPSTRGTRKAPTTISPTTPTAR